MLTTVFNKSLLAHFKQTTWFYFSNKDDVNFLI